MKKLKKVISIVILITMVMTLFTGCEKVKAVITDVGDSTSGIISMIGDKASALWQTINVKVFKNAVPEDVAPIDVTKPGETETEEPEIDPNNTLTVVLNATFCPYEFYLGDEVIGVDVEIAELLGEKLGRKVIIRDVSFDRLFTTLEEGKADLIISAITEENYKGGRLYFTDPYTKDTQSVVVKKRLSQSDRKIDSLADIEKGNVGVFSLSSATYYAEDYFDSASIQEYGSYSELFNALVNGAVNGVVVRSDVAKKYVDTIPEIEFYSKNLQSPRYVIAAKDKELRDEVNGILKKLISEGEIEKIVQQYIHLDSSGKVPDEETSAEPESETAEETTKALPVFVTNEDGDIIGTLPAETTAEETTEKTTAEAEEATTAKKSEEKTTEKSAEETTKGKKGSSSEKETE